MPRVWQVTAQLLARWHRTSVRPAACGQQPVRSLLVATGETISANALTNSCAWRSAIGRLSASRSTRRTGLLLVRIAVLLLISVPPTHATLALYYDDMM